VVVKKLALIFKGQGQGQGQMSGVNFHALGQPYPSVLVSCRSVERLPRYRGGWTKTKKKQKNKRTKQKQYPPLQTPFAGV